MKQHLNMSPLQLWTAWISTWDFGSKKLKHVEVRHIEAAHTMLDPTIVPDTFLKHCMPHSLTETAKPAQHEMRARPNTFSETTGAVIHFEEHCWPKRSVAKMRLRNCETLVLSSSSQVLRNNSPSTPPVGNSDSEPWCSKARCTTFSFVASIFPQGPRCSGRWLGAATRGNELMCFASLPSVCACESSSSNSSAPPMRSHEPIWILSTPGRRGRFWAPQWCLSN